jgi:glutaminase
MTAMMDQVRLETLAKEIRPHLRVGAVSDYLPQLAKSKVDDFAVSLDMCSDKPVSAGDVGVMFTMQSVVKVFTLLLALRDRGDQHVFGRVGREQAVGAFNSFETFGRSTGYPANPFVNSGALAVVDMLDGGNAEVRVSRVLELIRRLSDNPTIEVNQDVAAAEFANADRNRAICYFLRSCGIVTADIEDLMWAYCQMCAIQVGVDDLARAGGLLAHDSRIVSVPELPLLRDVHGVRRLMLTTGMYISSGWYSYAIGIPAKSGVSGAMLGIVPGVGGIGVYGPALDEASNSIGGVRMMGALATELASGKGERFCG